MRVQKMLLRPRQRSRGDILARRGLPRHYVGACAGLAGSIMAEAPIDNLLKERGILVSNHACTRLSVASQFEEALLVAG